MNQVPRDPEAVANAAADALRIARSDRAILRAIEDGATDWQKETALRLKRIETNLDVLVKHCQDRTLVACQLSETLGLARANRKKTRRIV